MVRGIELDPETGDTECSTCGYEFNDFKDAQRHFEEECTPLDKEIKPRTYTAEITIHAPAMNNDKARQNIQQWQQRVQNAIGGLSFQLNNLQLKEDEQQ